LMIKKLYFLFAFASIDLKVFMMRDLRKMSVENFHLECQFLGHEWPIVHE